MCRSAIEDQLSGPFKRPASRYHGTRTKVEWHCRDHGCKSHAMAGSSQMHPASLLSMEVSRDHQEIQANAQTHVACLCSATRLLEAEEATFTVPAAEGSLHRIAGDSDNLLNLTD